MRYEVHKCSDDEIEYLPDITETPIWRDYDVYNAPRSVRLVAALYKAVAERENYFQTNSPTAFGDPEYKMAYGIAHGIMIAAEIEECARDGKLFFYKGKKVILVVEKIKRRKSYYEEKREIQETLAAIL